MEKSADAKKEQVGSIPYAIQIPMKLDVYLNYGRRLYVDTPSQQRAYIAPISAPDFQGLQMKSGLVQHDIFEDTRQAPYLCSTDRYRRLDSRKGIYLHWSIPKIYRSGIAGSESASDVVNRQKQLGGFPTANAGNNSSTLTFRPIPTRWVIWRAIRGISTPPNSRIQTPRVQAPLGLTDQFWPGTFDLPRDPQTIHDCFIIESDCVRSTDAIPPTEDVEVTASPYVDPTTSIEQQGQVFLGRASSLDSWTADGLNPPEPIQITVAQAYNPFFADYQPQNSSVLSFFDDLSLKDPTPGGSSAPWYYTEAVVSYTVMGYHVTNNADPLYVATTLGQNLNERIAACGLKVDPLSSVLDPDYPANMRTLCYGNMLNIIWLCPPIDGTNPFACPNRMAYPADTLQQSFQKTHPVSVGTNALDALFAWLRSTETGSEMTTDEIRRNLMKLQTLILDINDDIDSQLQAEDLLATNNFIPGPNEVCWHFQAPNAVPGSTQSIIPTDDQAAKLRQLNVAQAQLNALNRACDQARAQLWATFWTYMADRSNGTANQQEQRLTNASLKIGALRSQISDDMTGAAPSISSLTQTVDQLTGVLGLLQAGTQQRFYTQRDPTLLVAGLQSQWPTDWDQNTTVRLNPASNQNPNPNTFQLPIFDPDVWQGKVPLLFQQPMTDLISESVFGANDYQIFKSAPYFGVQDRYEGQQGWFPLFVEWEVEYYHIPFELWEFGPQGPEARVGYSLKSEATVATENIQGDFRILTGRCPLLPQTGAVLESTLKQVFSKINPNEQFGPDGKTPMTEVQKVELLNAARTLDFSATSMSGLTDQLLTQMQGSHVTPLTNGPNGLEVVQDALDVGKDLEMTQADFLMMQGQTTITPFASLIDIPADHTKYTPFKPCIHGQFRFTKLNVVDKFGQVVRGIESMSDVSKSIGPTPTALFPCLGDSYSVEPNPDNVTANVVLPRTDSLCNFVQLPPSINQNARVNAAFVSPDPPQWRQLDEWENPVRGWLVINQANISLQVFSPDGYFVREFAVDNQPITRPFPADNNLVSGLDPIMQDLLEQFANPGWIQGFFQTVSQTVEEVQANPSSYSESMLSVLGRPLAVTAFSISLELADAPMSNQCTVAPTDPSVEPTDLLSYDFGLKIGDKNNVFDGLYGFFTAAPTVDPKQGAQINWNSFNSYHASDSAEQQIPGDPSRRILADLTIQPFYPDPHATDFSMELTKKQKVFVGIIDPFTAVNIYTALLPIRQLKLPPWTIENGVSKISTFFKLGPVLVPGDVQTFNADPTYVVAPNYRLGDATEPIQNGTIPVPAIGMGDWGWLQPYWVSGATKYNLLGVDPAVRKPGFEPVPYTAVEGYLQQKRPFSKPDPMNS